MAGYSYLGRNGFVEVDYVEPDVKYTLVDLTGSNDPDTGDIYSGLDRFGRVKDSRWYDYAGSADVDRIKYGYDRAGNRLWRENLVADHHGGGFDELDTYDGSHRLADMQRGDLNANKDGINNKAFAQDWTLDPTGNWGNFKEDEDGRVFDFHALRHQYISMLARHGVHPKTAQELARHSKITLTMDHYTHLRLNDHRPALQSLPSLPSEGSETTAATGTDDRAEQKRLRKR